ncbi:MAG: hypothetical protein RIB98_06115 [Acidimicrobiales bacterium]
MNDADDERDAHDESEELIEEMTPKSFAGGNNLDQLMPIILFFGFRIVLDNLVLAVVASLLWSIKAAISRHRRGVGVGWFLPGIATYLTVRAGLTIAVDRSWIDVDVSADAVYFGFGIIGKILIGVACALTIFAGRPILAWLIPKVVPLPATVIADPRFRKAMNGATWVLVAFELLTSVWDIWLYNNSGLGFFFLTRSGVNFIVSFACITGALIYIDRTLDPIPDYPGITHLMEESGRIRS